MNMMVYKRVPSTLFCSILRVSFTAGSNELCTSLRSGNFLPGYLVAFNPSQQLGAIFSAVVNNAIASHNNEATVFG